MSEFDQKEYNSVVLGALLSDDKSRYELVPELHDILKLCNSYLFAESRRKKSPHSNPHSVLIEAENKSFNLKNNATWWGILKHHHGWNFKLYPDTPELFQLDMADSLAAAISRGDNQLRLGCKRPFIRYGFDDRVFKLWKHRSDECEKRRKVRPLDLEKVFIFLGKNPSLNDFFGYVNDSIYERAEDATIGANLTSLYIHSILAGRFYRILKKANFNVTAHDLGSNRKQLVSLYKNRMENWTLAVSKLKIHFPQKPVRTKDMNVFWKLSEIRKKITQDFQDNIFFNTSDEILMLHSPQQNIEMLKPYLDCGFWIEYSQRIQLLKDLNPNPDSEKSIGYFKEGVVYGNLPLKKLIEPPICEICQKDKATKEWVKDYILNMEICENCKKIISEQSWPPDETNICGKDLNDIKKWFDENIGEDLCESCFNIRIKFKKTRLRKLEKWSENEWYEKEEVETGIINEETKKEYDPKVIWIKINLDFFGLINSLERLYERYLKNIGVKAIENAEIRFSVLSEFHKDYGAFLKDFERSLRNKFNDDMEVPILDDFFVIRINTLNQIMEVVTQFNVLFNRYFSQFYYLDNSPLKLSVSCSSAKFPFFEHWEILRNPKSDVHIVLIGKGELKISVKNLDEIIIRADQGSTKSNIGVLHKLAQISEISEKLAEIALKDSSDEDYKKLKEILPMGMDFQSLLTFIKIVEASCEVYEV